MKTMTGTSVPYMAAAAIGLAVLGWSQLGKQESAQLQDFARTPSFTAPAPAVTESSSVSLPKPLQTDPSPASASDPLTSEVSQLREYVATLIEHQSLTQEDLDGLRERVNMDTSSDDDSLAATPEEETAAMESKFSQMTAYLERETPDPDWGGETRASVEQSLNQAELPAATLLESTCGSTLCKVKLNLPTDLSHQESLQRLSARRSWDGATMFKLSSSGEVDFYIARVGHDLPVE